MDLKYFKDEAHGFLLAYEASSEFFVRYLQETDEWEDCRISFSQFRHDYYFREVERDEALHMANGNLPEAQLQRYLALVAKNKRLD